MCSYHACMPPTFEVNVRVGGEGGSVWPEPRFVNYCKQYEVECKGMGVVVTIVSIPLIHPPIFMVGQFSASTPESLGKQGGKPDLTGPYIKLGE